VGHDVCQLLLEGCKSCDDLNEAMRIINNFYRVYHNHMVFYEDVNRFKEEVDLDAL